MEHVYCCPICGDILRIDSMKAMGYISNDEYKCLDCNNVFETPYKSIYNTNYYIGVAKNRFSPYENVRGNSGGFRWKEILEEEVSNNPLFNQEEYNKRVNREKSKSQIKNNNYNNDRNVPKCPTCGSTSISKISATSKVLGGALFGFFSKTAMSQFKCNKCGYKW